MPKENNPIILQNPLIPPKKKPKLLQKTLDAIKLCEAGLSPKEALQCANMTTKISSAAVSNFKHKLKEYTLNAVPVAHLASNQIKRILRARAREETHRRATNTGQIVEYVDNVYPTDSNILAAASMVYDRYEPTIQRSISVVANIMDLHPVDISEYLTPIDNIKDVIDL